MFHLKLDVLVFGTLYTAKNRTKGPEGGPLKESAPDSDQNDFHHNTPSAYHHYSPSLVYSSESPN